MTQSGYSNVDQSRPNYHRDRLNIRATAPLYVPYRRFVETVLREAPPGLVVDVGA